MRRGMDDARSIPRLVNETHAVSKRHTKNIPVLGTKLKRVCWLLSKIDQ